MRRDLHRPVAPASLPSGVHLLPFDAPLAPACRALMNRVYAAGFGDVVAFDDWWPRLTADAEYDPALCFAVADAHRIVGFCQCWTEPFIKDIVVGVDWRGRGVATALLTAAMAAYVARGAAYVDLKTDVDNLVAQSVYRRAGFAIVERFD